MGEAILLALENFGVAAALLAVALLCARIIWAGSVAGSWAVFLWVLRASRGYSAGWRGAALSFWTAWGRAIVHGVERFSSPYGYWNGPGDWEVYGPDA